MNDLVYQAPQPITRAQFREVVATGTTPEIAEALIGIINFDHDGYWLEAQCLELLSHPDWRLRGSAIMGLGHIARIHLVSSPIVTTRLKDFLTDPRLFGYATEALEDIEFLSSGRLARMLIRRRNKFWEWRARRERASKRAKCAQVRMEQ